MKILKLLNKKYLPIFIICFLSLSLNLKAEDEPVDIWDLGKELEQNSSNVKNENSDIDEIKIDSVSTQTGNTINKINSNVLGASKINIVGLYDPEDNGLNIDMWSKSNGSEIKLILDKLNKMNLSKDSKEILDITLLTNSYFPSENITEEDFIDYKLKYLIKNNDKKLIKSYLIKNEKNIYNSKLIKFYIDDHIENSDLEKACKIFDEIKYFSDDYINKFKIYCLIDQGKREEAQLLYDLNKEFGFKDDFYEKKFNFLMGYNEKEDENISDKNILNFHLSHRTNNNFSYQPNEKSPKFIWKYLSSSNLLENINEINLEDIEKISLIEKATHEQNYEEKELFELYKRFQFNINQLLNVKESYKLMQGYEGRALLYQRLILTKDTNELLELSYKLKESFIKDKIENAFSIKLKEILSNINEEEVPSNYSSFYSVNLKTETLEKKKHQNK